MNRTPTLILNHSSVESGKGSETAWERGPGIGSRGRFGNLSTLSEISDRNISLEHFFEENPFPTYTDKVFLAKKSNMQCRQLHV